MKTLHCPRCGTSIGNVKSATCGNGHTSLPMIDRPNTGSKA